ncbi:MAG: HAMP domain-containing sensor histidine kinase [Aestuariivirga sp.]
MQFNPKILKTSTFRLAAIYLLVFAVSVGSILAYVFWNTAGLLERQTDATIRAEVQALADQYRLLGLRGIVDTVRRRSAERGGGVYLLADANGKRVAGNLGSVPPEMIDESGWIDFPLDIKVGDAMQRRSARAFHADLTGDYELVVGRDVQESRLFGDIIRRTVYWALGIALVLGLGGGLLTSRNFLHRVDAITDASRTIMGGDLSSRMPIAGSGDELDKLALSLNEMLDQIERLMTGMKEVTSNVAHDLKTPLTRLKARVESALRSNSKAEYRAALDKTIEESDRLLQTFNALLSIARAESGQSRDLLQATDAREIVEDVAELYEPIAEEEGGTLAVSAAPGLNVLADRQLLSQTLSNLVDNALKYGVTEDNPKPHIEITGKLEQGSVVIVVADRGAGIPAEDRARVLDRFVRLEPSRSKPGNGLGLSLVAGVMKLHGGALLLEDNEPGLRAKLVLPLHPMAG